MRRVLGNKSEKIVSVLGGHGKRVTLVSCVGLAKIISSYATADVMTKVFY